MKMERNLVAFLMMTSLGMFLSGHARAASPSAPQPQVTYSKATVSFSPVNFTLSYGQTGTICATVTPSRLASKFAWVNSATAAGVFTITPGTDPSCNNGAGVFLTVTSSTQTACLTEGGVVAVFNGKPVKKSIGTVLLPDKIYSTFYQAGIGPSMVTYLIHFASNEGASPNFNGLPVVENLQFPPPNSCHMTLPPPGALLDGNIGMFQDGTPAPSNTTDDADGQWPLPTSCLSVVQQTFTMGACTFPLTPINITVQAVSGADTVTRNDCTGQNCVGGP